MNDQQVDGDNANARPANGRRQRARAGNSLKFNQMLSDFNMLSVAEKTRFVKAASGQIGLTAISLEKAIALSNNVTDNNAKAKTQEGQPQRGLQPGQRPNPLHGTVMEKSVEDAKAAIRAEKERLKVTMLPQDNPVVLQYNTAISAYKAEKAKLAPVVPAIAQSGHPVANKRKADKSPERVVTTSTSILGSVVKKFSGSNRNQKTSQNQNSEGDMDTL